MADSELKVNDKRMFNADGGLREEFRHLENASGEPREQAPPVAAPPNSEPPPAPPESPSSASQRGVALADLVGLLAEHAAVYLGERALPDGESLTDLRAAQLHIDLLDVLREKTAGNLSQQETAMLEDVLYQLRLAYVERRRRGA